MTASGAGPAAVLIEADGGSRGNPGPAGYGAVLKDAATGRVIAEDGTPIGVATNNVAEYNGLIAGLRLAAEFAPEADIEVRMDSKLVVEQMSGRWKIKHPDMKPLAMEANRLAPFGTVYTWVPRERNKHADRLANEALDGVRNGVTAAGDSAPSEPESLVEPEPADQTSTPSRGWSGARTATTLVLVRHGVTAHTLDKRFSGGLTGANPGLSEEGRAQMRATAEWLSPLGEHAAAVVASPVRRTRESADLLAARLDLDVVEEAGFAEMDFGSWEGLTFPEVQARDPEAMRRWFSSVDEPAGGGESFRAVQRRVLRGLGTVLGKYAGQTVVVATHVTPIKTLVADAMGAPLDSLFAMELSPASVTVVSYYADDRSSLRLFNAVPTGETIGGW